MMLFKHLIFSLGFLGVSTNYLTKICISHVIKPHFSLFFHKTIVFFPVPVSVLKWHNYGWALGSFAKAAWEKRKNEK